MFVRWKVRRECAVYSWGHQFEMGRYHVVKDHFRYTLLLVENARTPGVKTPRQRTIACLGTVDEWLMSPLGHCVGTGFKPGDAMPEQALIGAANARTKFWNKLGGKLDRLSYQKVLSRDDVKRIRADLLERIPPYHHEGAQLVVAPLILPAGRRERSQETERVRGFHSEMRFDAHGEPVPWNAAVEAKAKEDARKAALTPEEQAAEAKQLE